MFRFIQKGFTVIEVLVVFAIISLLSAVMLTSPKEARLKAHDESRIAHIDQIALALRLYYEANGKYPEVRCDSRVMETGFGGYGNAGRYDFGNNGKDCWGPGGLLYDALVPGYMPQLPIDPVTRRGEGYMCSNCGEYFYDGYGLGTRLYGRSFMLTTYLATNHPKKSGLEYDNYHEVPAATPAPFVRSGSVLYGPFYGITSRCRLTAQNRCTPI